MGLYNNFPYTNFHEMNLDWILNQLKELVNEWDSYGTTVSATAHESTDPEVTVTGDLKNGLSFDFGLVKGAKGTTGAQGPEGPEGPPGSGLEILDVYTTLADLQADHPTGSPGDMYLVGTGGSYTLYVWSESTNSWADGGSLSAPAPSNVNPVMNGTADPGASALYSRGDHVHPSDTSKLDVSNTDGVYGVDSGSQIMFSVSDNSSADTIVMYDSSGDLNTANLNASADISCVDINASGDIDVSGDATIGGDLNVTGDLVTNNDILNSQMLDAEINGLNSYRPLARIDSTDVISVDYDIATLVPGIKMDIVDYDNTGTRGSVNDEVYFTDAFTVDTINYSETRIDIKKASALQLGAVKIGSGVNVAADGTISVSPSSDVPFTSSGSVTITNSTSTAGAPVYDTPDLYYKMTADAKEFMIFGTVAFKGSGVGTRCDITTSLQVDPPSAEIVIPGIPIVSQSSTATAGNYLSIDTNGYVHLNVYSVVNKSLMTLIPIRIKISDWS